MNRRFLSCRVVLVAVSLVVGWPSVAMAVKEERCERWDDIDTNLALPEEMVEMRMLNRIVYGESDQSFRYGSREFIAEIAGKRVLTVYLYKRDGAKLDADGICEAVERELSGVIATVRQRPDVKRMEVLEKRRSAKIGATDCLVAESVCTDVLGVDRRDWALVCSFMGRFLKLRYSECVTDEDGKSRPSRWPEIVKTVGGLMDRARQDRKLDVYAIDDATNRLVAICRKWVGADNRVSMWKMPGFSEKLRDIEKFQEWCNENPIERYQYFERAVRDAIGLRIEPAVWYYNLACVLAVQGKRDVAFEALEQAAAAGCGTFVESKDVRADSDLFSLTNDVRFSALCAAMDADVRPCVKSPRQAAEDIGGVVRLSDENVYYDLKEGLYLVNLTTTNPCPIVYVNHHKNHPDIPCDGLISAVYPEEAHEECRDIGPADIVFCNAARTLTPGEVKGCPTIVASDEVLSVDKSDGARSIPARQATDSAEGREGLLCEYLGTLGVYATGDEYGGDGVDRFLGNFPIGIAHAGGADESDKFVRLAAEMIRAMPESFRGARAAMVVPTLIRRAQKFVKTEADFMTGRAHRPVIRFADIDCKKAVELAASLTDAHPLPAQPMFDRDAVRASTNLTFVINISSPYNNVFAAVSAVHISYMVRAAERTQGLAIKTLPIESGKLVWKVLQGDPEKVCIVEKDDGETEISVDHQPVFEIEGPDGKKMKSCRVDVGCFHVGDDGQVSSPSIVSFCHMPNETRVYGKDGRLESIDYTQRQFKGCCPKLCPKGDWKDVFKWTDGGRLLGWTRIRADANGEVTTNEFTRNGLVVDTRDALGRPNDVHLSMYATWLQELSPTNMTRDAAADLIGWMGHQYDFSEGEFANTTLAWQYTYEHDADVFGKSSPKEAKPFAYRPGLCRRADFADPSTGFRLPFLSQVELGYEIYSGYKHDIVGQFVNDFEREDSALALKSEGLVPPKVLKKMKFCKWSPSTNDIWKVKPDLAKVLNGNALWELADGSCRFEGASVNQTYRTLNFASEVCAYEVLDRNYRRCTEGEVKRVLADIPDNEWSKLLVVEGEFVFDEVLPEEKNFTVTMWQISEGVYFVILADRCGGACFRTYCIRTIDKKTGEVLSGHSFLDLPSLAVGNTVLAAVRGDPAAANNLAVLLYAGVADPGEYEEEPVIVLLESAAKAGNATAVYNLGVLDENRGDRSSAAKRYAEAKVMRGE